MSLLFGKGSPKERLISCCMQAIAHGKILAILAFVYKSVQCFLANLRQKADPIHSFIAGMCGSYCLLYVFKTDNSINRQGGYYMMARVLEGLVLKLIKEGYFPNHPYYNKVYMLMWGLVMLIYEMDSKALNRTLSSSMKFLYKDSDKPLKSYTELVPFDVP